MLKHISDTYEIIEKIGVGNSGEVYKAYHKNLKKYVVLKKIRAELKDVLNNRAEADVLKNLHHPCLPQVFDFLEADGDVYTVMDYIPGNSFKEYLDAGTEFKEKSVLIWARQICATLSYLHSQKPPIIHSDLKPGNIMLKPDGNICLIDFNISASLDGDTAWVTGYTNGYAPPEQIEALRYNQNELDHSLWKTIDRRADIYSLGAVLYHLMTGKKPSQDENGYVEDIRSRGIRINQVFAHIIMKCLEPRPEKRYQSAEALLSDLKDIEKKDRRYRELCKKQKGIYILVIFFMAVSAVLTVNGYFRRDVDRRKQYEELVRLESQCVTSGEFENFESYYQKAAGLMPERLEAYYQKALALNQQRQYGDNINFINEKILSNPELEVDSEALNNVYYLLGNSYEKQEDYENAAKCYEKAIEIKPDNSDYYRDYAIALAYTGEMDKAQKALDTARRQGLDSVEIDYVQGEILYNNQDFQGAKEIFLICMEKAQNDYVKMRACIMTCKCIDALEDGVGGYDEKIQLLEKARKELPTEYNIGVLETLGQVYSDMGNDTGDAAYYTKAAEVFKQIQKQGMGSYDTDYNLVVLYQNMGKYDEASALLKEMLEEYGENYRTYKALAFMEVSKQEKVDVNQRSYGLFKEYYEKAEKLYQQQLENNVNDMEMKRLKELYDQAASNGWFSS